MLLKVEPAKSHHLNEETELIGIAQVTSADKLVMQLTVICK